MPAIATTKTPSPFCRHWHKKGATLSRNPLFYLVELAGVEPASEIPTFFWTIKKNKGLSSKSAIYMTMVNKRNQRLKCSVDKMWITCPKLTRDFWLPRPQDVWAQSERISLSF